MEKFTFDSAVRGYHIYKVVWKPTIGEKLQVDQEFGNKADKFALKVVKNNEFAMKVVKNNEIVGNLPREYSRTLWYFIARGEQESLINTRRHKRLLSEPYMKKSTINNSHTHSVSFVFIS